MSSTDGRLGRRDFVRTLAGVSAVTAAAAALPTTDAQAYDPGADETRPRYRETEHVKTFYRVNGYEASRT